MTAPQPAALPECFTKKPVTIEAVQFRNDSSSYALIQWINEGQHAAGRRFASWQNQEIIVPTLEGEHIASPGDWIIKGVKGEFYPCKPDIFEMTYDRAALQRQPAAFAPTVHIKEPYTLAELNARIASNDYNAELLLHHAMLLLNAQPAAAGVSDADIARAVRPLYADDDAAKMGLPDDIKTARAILALRPQAVPMTREQRKAVVEAAEILMKADINLPWRDAIMTATEAHFGITAQGAQGGEAK